MRPSLACCVDNGPPPTVTSKGLQAALDHIAENLLPIFKQQEKARERRIRSGQIKG